MNLSTTINVPASNHEGFGGLLDRIKKQALIMKKDITSALEQLVSITHIEQAQEKITAAVRQTYIPLLITLGGLSLSQEAQAQSNLFKIYGAPITAFTDLDPEEDNVINGRQAGLGRDHKGNDTRFGYQINADISKIDKTEELNGATLSHLDITAVSGSFTPYITIGEYGLNDYCEEGVGGNIGVGIGASGRQGETYNIIERVTREDMQMVRFIEPKVGLRHFSGNGNELGVEAFYRFLQGENADTFLDGINTGKDNGGYGGIRFYYSFGG